MAAIADPQPATLRVVIYCRVSRDVRQGRSVEQQEAELRADCADRGWHVVAVLVDNDRSASPYAKKDRPAWAQVLRMVEAGEVDVVATWEGSRAQRDLDKYTALRGLCVASGVRWYYGGRLYDLAHWRDRRDTGRDAVDDEAESGKTSERIRRDVRAAALAGRPHGRRLFGYRRTYDGETGELLGQEAHPDEAPVVRRIFAEFLAGKAMRTIATGLNADGHRTGTGAAWADTQVKRALRNPAYAARRVHGGEVVGPAAWPPLVDPDVFDRAAARLEAMAARKSPQRRTTRLLTGVARCGVCGGRLLVGHDRKTRKVYQCRTGFHVARDERMLDAFVTSVLLERLKRADVAEAFGDGPEDPRVAEARERAAGLRVRLDEAVAEFTAGRLSAALLARVEADLTGQIAEAERQARAALVPLDLDLPEPDGVEAWWDGLDRAQQREVVGALLAAVVVHRMEVRGRRSFDPDSVAIEWRRS